MLLVLRWYNIYLSLISGNSLLFSLFTYGKIGVKEMHEAGNATRVNQLNKANITCLKSCKVNE